MNPFDDEDGTFAVLCNVEEQYSLWPTFLDVPAGWDVVVPEASRQEALDYVERTWTNILPRSVRERLDRSAAAPSSGPEPSGGTDS